MSPKTTDAGNDYVELVHISTFVNLCVGARAKCCGRAVAAFSLHNAEIINVFTWLPVCFFKKPNESQGQCWDWSPSHQA